MNKKQTKFILFLVGALIIFTISLILAIIHIDYAVNFKDWFSYMTRENAIIVSVIAALIALASLSLVIYSIIKIIKINKSERIT